MQHVAGVIYHQRHYDLHLEVSVKDVVDGLLNYHLYVPQAEFDSLLGDKRRDEGYRDVRCHCVDDATALVTLQHRHRATDEYVHNQLTRFVGVCDIV